MYVSKISWISLSFSLAVCSTNAPLALAQLAQNNPADGSLCQAWLPGSFHNQSVGTFGSINASTVWNTPAGTPWLVVGGHFDQIGGINAKNIAAWDGASWRPFGNGADSTVYALTTYNGQLIAGGFFDHIDGVAAKRIAQFDGSTWAPLGSGLQLPNFPQNEHCRALAVYNNELIVTGDFWSAGGVSARNIARWNGSAWAPLGFPGTGIHNVSPADPPSGKSLAVYNGSLYVGGDFEVAGGVNAAHIARWDGNNWHALGSGVNSIVHYMTTYNNELVISGSFSQAGGQTIQSVARWNGGAWLGFTTSFPGLCDALHVHNGQLYAGFWDELSVWTGSSWALVGGGLSGPWVWTMASFGGNLVACGQFGQAGSPPVQVNNIAQWNGVNWSTLQVKPAVVTAMETFGSRLFVGGAFVQSTTDGVPASNVMMYDGQKKWPLQQGVNAVPGFEGAVDSVRALKAYSEGGVFGGDRLVVGGYFTSAGGMAVNRIAMWNEPPFTLPHWSAMGNGFNAGVLALERYNGAIYAGGEFTFSGNTAMNHVAKWNGNAWEPADGGVFGNVYAMKVFNGELYVGGDFTVATGIVTGGLAKWNGTNWSAVNGAFNGTVYALEVIDGKLMIGGVFSTLPGSPNIVGYDGNTFFAPNAGGTNGPVLAMKAHGDSLYVGGFFTFAGGQLANRIARWNEVDGWRSVDTGVDAVVYALASFQNQLHAGGAFNAVGSASLPARAWARWVDDLTPVILQQPESQATNCHDSVSFAVAVSADYPTSLTWRKNGQAMVNGTTAQGSTISGANSATLVIDNVHAFDAGDYTCHVETECGFADSNSAVLLVENCCIADIAPAGGDGLVNVADMLAVINAWGDCPQSPGTCLADVSPFGGDSAVNVQDLLAIINGWGACQ